MTGKRYYITTLGAWRRQVARFAHSHFVVLEAREVDATQLDATGELPGGDSEESLAEAATILVLVEGDEGAHLALEDEAAFEALPHPLSQRAVSKAAQSALAVHGVAPGATTFEAAEAAGRIHPLLRHRAF